MTIRIISTRHYKAGYIVQTCRVSGADAGFGPLFTTKVARTPDGHYIGDEKMAYHLCVKRGIAPEVSPGNRVCSIGFSKSNQKWYGW